MGELDNNLFTNQNLVGKSRQELSGQELIKVEFYDYLYQPLIPNNCRVQPIEIPGQYYIITATESTHSLGIRNNGWVNEPWQIIDNTMIVKGSESTDENIITSIYRFKFDYLTTNEKEYTKFRFKR